MLIFGDTQFKGGNTAINAKMLAEGLGTSATNIDTSHGDLRGRKTATTVHTLVGYGSTQQQAIYRMGRETASDTLYWLAFTVDVDFARSLLANDPTERTYGTGGNFLKPAYTDNTFLGSTPYPTGAYWMGVPAPGSGMTATVSTEGDGNNETRSYVATFTRYNGDESAPGPATELICKGGSTATLTTFPADPSSAHGVTGRNFYVSTGGDYRLIGSNLLADTTFTDDGTRSTVLQTGGDSSKPAWVEPYDGMIGLLELWNGMHGGFYQKQYGVCVPYNPHAWPVQYRRQVPDRIVGTARFGQSWVLATTGLPRVVEGRAPEGMQDKPINLREACVSKRSVVSVDHGVCWASQRGLCYYGTNGKPRVLTEHVVTPEEWRALVPSTIIGAHWRGWYIGFYNDGTRKAFMVNTMAPEDGIVWVNQGAYATFSDPLSETLYLLDSGNTIKKWDAGTVGNLDYTSRIYRQQSPTNVGAAKVIATTYPVTFALYADGSLKATVTVTSDDPFRLPAGYLAEEFQYRVYGGTGPIEGVFGGEEIEDLP